MILKIIFRQLLLYDEIKSDSEELILILFKSDLNDRLKSMYKGRICFIAIAIEKSTFNKNI